MAKALAIIPARGGSKRIPRKNIRLFHGRPLIAYSIETAKESGLFDRIVVSTDDEEIAETAKSFGAEVPFLRPAELADDYAGTDAVADHAVEWFKKRGERYDYACTIYATAPLLTAEDLIRGFEALRSSDAVHAFSATSMPFPIQRTFRITPEGRCEMFFPEHYSSRSQDLDEAYQDAGQFYWRNLARQSDQPMFGRDSVPVLLPRWRVQDIDTSEDWERAEKLYGILHPDRYDRWNRIKKRLGSQKPLKFREGEIFFLSVGMNVGYEVYGKKEEFLRPVLVLKKTGRTTFYGIPLTSQSKEGSYYYTFEYKKGKVSTALLHQMRLFDIRRAKYFSGRIKKSDFGKIKESIKEVLGVTPSKKRGSGHTLAGLPEKHIKYSESPS